MDIVVSDFDNTLFKRNYGLITENVFLLEKLNLPVYIVTYRSEDQLGFLSDTLSKTNLDIIGYAFAGSRQKDPTTKLVLIDAISKRYNIVAAKDDDNGVVSALRRRGIRILE